MQTCIVHQIRNRMRYLAYKERKAVARDLKAIYRAVNADAAEAALAAFDERWGLALPDDRRLLARALAADHAVSGAARRPAPRGLTTNSIENLNRQIRKAIKTRGRFPDQQAATKLINLAIARAERKWRTAYNWTDAPTRPQDPLRRLTARRT